jgi:nucleoside-diphosphate-sugar epimerase
MRIALSGGTGFVGGHLTAQFRALGHDVAQLPRTAYNDASPSQLRGFDALIHAAWDLRNPEVNVANSQQLLNAAKAADVPRILFISSLSAFDGCRSRYGAMKLAVEKMVRTVDGRSVRLGFVCDDSNRGLSGSLKKLAALPVIPLPGGGQQNLFTIQAEDLAPAFVKIIARDDRDPVSLAHPEPVTLASLMRAFARQQGRSARFLPVPWRMLWAPLRIADAAGLKLKFRSDSLVSLMNQNPSPDFRALGECGIMLRGFHDRK